MRHGHSLALAWSIAGLVLVLPQAVEAKDEILMSADVATTGGYSNNPFSEDGTDLGSAYVDINAKPKIRLINEHSVLSLTGIVDYKHYLREYSDSSDYQGALDYVATPTSRLTTHANVLYDSSILGGIEALSSSTDLSQPQPTPTTGTDIALYGARIRRQSFDNTGDVTYNLAAQSTLTANAFYDVVRYSGASSLTSYNGYGGGVGYAHRFSDHLKLGLQGSIARYVYRGLLGDAQIYSLQGTFNDTINSYWTLSGAVGGSYSDRTVGGKTTYVTGNALLCRATTRSSLCLNGGQSVLPTGTTGTVATQVVGGSYSYELSEHSKLSLTGSYTHNDAPILQDIVGNGYITSTLTYDRTLKERVHFISTARYRKLTGGVGNRPDDYGGTIGIAVKLGEYQ